MTPLADTPAPLHYYLRGRTAFTTYDHDAKAFDFDPARLFYHLFDAFFALDNLSFIKVMTAYVLR